MTMAKNFKELQEKMPREARLRSEASAEKMISEMGLAEERTDGNSQRPLPVISRNSSRIATACRASGTR